MTEFPPPGENPEYDIALDAVAYGDLQRASETFNMLELAGLIMAKASGEEVDEERMNRLAAVLHQEPQLSSYDDEVTGERVIVDEDDNEVRREPATPESLEWANRIQARKTTISDFVAATMPMYVDAIQARLEAAQAADPQVRTTALSIIIKRGGDGRLVSRNELEMAALDRTRDTLREQGLTVKEEHRRIGADGRTDHPKAGLTHSRHTLFVSLPSEPTPDQADG